MKIKVCLIGLFVVVCALSFVPRDVYASSPLVEAILQQTDNKERHIDTEPKSFPAKFDLRSCDLDGNGELKNYVTSTKLQNTWGNCWAHGGIAAAEISILAKQRQNSVTVDATGKKRDSLDLSEHHLSWFNYAPMTAAETPTHAGEGAYSFREEEAKAKGLEYWWSKRLNSGGIGMSVTSAFSRGDGPVREPDWNNPNLTPQQKQLLYKGKNEYKAKDVRGFDVYSEADDWAIDDDQRSKKDYELNEAYILPDAATF
ncbi:MAG: hypothetical protein Q4E88_02385 [Coriobacteriia bacterium]|nr:hypothetical protein [Coriobacteriia bacterium]